MVVIYIVVGVVLALGVFVGVAMLFDALAFAKESARIRRAIDAEAQARATAEREGSVYR